MTCEVLKNNPFLILATIWPIVNVWHLKSNELSVGEVICQCDTTPAML